MDTDIRTIALTAAELGPRETAALNTAHAAHLDRMAKFRAEMTAAIAHRGQQ